MRNDKKEPQYPGTQVIPLKREVKAADGTSEMEDYDLTLHFRTPEEENGLVRAATFGNRLLRRRRYFGAAGEPDPIKRTERNKRNAKRRIAKKQRKINGG